MSAEILDRPIAFHRCFVNLTGSINAALMLSQAVYWQRKNEDGKWWFQTREKWTDETGLTRDEQETARKRLVKFDFWKEELRGIPAKLYFNVDVAKLAELLSSSPSSFSSCTQPVGGNAPNSEGAIPPAIVGKETKQETKEVCGKRQKQPKMVAPSLEEVKAKCEQLNAAPVEAERFWHYYESNGWMVGRNPMKSWKSALEGWLRRNLQSNSKPPTAFNQPVIQKMDLKTKIKLLEEQIASHPANPEFIGASDCPTDAQRADIKRRRADLEAAKSQLYDLL